MKFNNRIKELYGSVDNMIKETGTQISRAYFYHIITGRRKNVTLDIAQELVTILKLNNIEELMELIHDSNTEEVQ